MQSKEEFVKLVKDFKAKYATEGEDENIIATIHIMNFHLIDLNEALDHSSRSSDDHGIDAWHYDNKSNELCIYQSKFSESKSLVLSGLNDLIEAKNWLEDVLINRQLEKIPHNPCLYNLYIELSRKNKIKKINFVLLSLFNSNEIEDKSEYEECKKELIESNLNSFLQNTNSKIDLIIEQYDSDRGLPRSIKKYKIPKIENSRISLRKNAHLDLAYIPLYDLIELYRQRGDVLFDKNVRLSLIDSKEAKARLVHPIETTFDLICNGDLSPDIFPFYHVGVTLAATSNEIDRDNVLYLQSPGIINGCQTITIADKYFRALEKENNPEKINLFKKINVIAKVVIGTTDDELREITNSNNRQNPIENWQLFSNDPIHIEIEAVLKEAGIFYERQKGKFNALMTRTDQVSSYINTNNSFINILDLGQIICLCRRNLQWAAKPSEIFLNKKNHDVVFDRLILRYPKEIVLVSNYFKALKRGLAKYLELPSHDNDSTHKIFIKPIVKVYMYYMALIYFYQRKEKSSLIKDYSVKLKKIASPILTADFESFYSRIISKTKVWYLDQSKNFSNDVSSKKLEEFIQNLAIELGIDLDGEIPFTENSIKWSNYE